jgi:hypothetical protein
VVEQAAASGRGRALRGGRIGPAWRARVTSHEPCGPGHGLWHKKSRRLITGDREPLSDASSLRNNGPSLCLLALSPTSVLLAALPLMPPTGPPPFLSPSAIAYLAHVRLSCRRAMRYRCKTHHLASGDASSSPTLMTSEVAQHAWQRSSEAHVLREADASARSVSIVARCVLSPGHLAMAPDERSRRSVTGSASRPA